MISKKELRSLLESKEVFTYWLRKSSSKNGVKYKNYSWLSDKVHYENVVKELNKKDSGWTVKCEDENKVKTYWILSKHSK